MLSHIIWPIVYANHKKTPLHVSFVKWNFSSSQIPSFLLLQNSYLPGQSPHTVWTPFSKYAPYLIRVRLNLEVTNRWAKTIDYYSCIVFTNHIGGSIFERPSNRYTTGTILFQRKIFVNNNILKLNVIWSWINGPSVRSGNP